MSANPLDSRVKDFSTGSGSRNDENLQRVVFELELLGRMALDAKQLPQLLRLSAAELSHSSR